MPNVTVEVKYSSSGKEPNLKTNTVVYVSKIPATESEVTASVRKKHPNWNFFILSIKQ
jgi:hypothetical protein